VPPLGLTINAKNQIGDTGFVYDAAGNLTNTPNPGGLTMQYDAENRMTSAAGVSYTYDGDGKRVMKSTAGTPPQPFKLYWFGISSDPLFETDAAGNVTDEYIFFAGKRTARRKSPSGEIHYYFADHLGSSRVVTSAAGAILDDSDFYPFGGERVITASTDNPYLFTGKERDPESGLDFFGARYYWNGYGRMESPDPGQKSGFENLEDPQGWNGYAYARNNPVNFGDPSGEGYFVCGTAKDGKEECASVGEKEEFEKFKEENKDLIFEGGKIFTKNADGSRRQIGTYVYEGSTDVSDDFLSGALRVGNILRIGIKESFRGAVRSFFKQSVRSAVDKAKEDSKEDLRKKALVPKDSATWRGLEPYRGAIKKTGSGRATRYFKWDHTHGHIEVFDRNGNHIGVMDASTGVIDASRAVPGRNIKDELK
jgi:RHS repeat-associated protein